MPTAAPTAEQIQKVESIFAAAKEIDPEPPPAEVAPPTMNLDLAIKSAWDAQLTFGAARREAEKARDATEARGREVGRQEAELRARTTELNDRDKALQDQHLRLAERERNAEAGFLDERRRMIEALESQVTEMRGQIAALVTEADERRSAEEAAWRERLEERAQAWRQEEDLRAERWRREDDERAAFAQKERRRLAEEIAAARALAQQAREEEEARHAAQMRAKEQEVESLRAKLVDEQRALRLARAEVAVEREVLGEDRQALDAKVARVAAARVAELERQLAITAEQLQRAKAERDGYWSDLESRRELDRLFGGERPEQILDRLRQLEREGTELRAELCARLPEASALRLAELEKGRSAWLDEMSVLRAKLAEAEARAGRQRVGAIELETLRAKTEALETNKKLLEAAVDELRAEVEKYTQQDEKKNPLEALIALDRRQELQTPQHVVTPLERATPTLKDFARDLRHRLVRAIDGRTLYYSERDVRCFLGGLAMTRLVLLQGISGTGKTSLPISFARATGAGDALVEVQAGWRDRQDLVGYYNAFHRHYYANNFLQALYRAGTPAFRDRLFFIVLDEINLSRVEQFFADFLSALELPEQRRRLTLLSDPVPDPPALMVEGQHLPIPPNVWFVGTANHDETTTDFADKTYDRAHIMELLRRDLDSERFEARPGRERSPISYKELMGAFETARQDHAVETQKALAWLRPGSSVADLLDRRFRIGWGNRLERDVEQFVPVVVAAGGTSGEAVDHLLATKVLRKLKDRHDVRAPGLDDLKNELLSSWKVFGGQPERSLDLLERELRAKHDEESAG